METTHRNENKLQTQTPESSKIVFSNTTVRGSCIINTYPLCSETLGVPLFCASGWVPMGPRWLFPQRVCLVRLALGQICGRVIIKSVSDVPVHAYRSTQLAPLPWEVGFVGFFWAWLSAAPTVLPSGPVSEEVGSGDHLSRRVSPKRTLDRKLQGWFEYKIENHRENQ